MDEVVNMLIETRINMEKTVNDLKRLNADIRAMSMAEYAKECVAEEAKKQRQETGW